MKPVLIFDFDGTLQQLFVNYDFKATSKKLSICMKDYGIDFDSSLDPFDVFKVISKDHTAALIEADRLITIAEREATKTGINVPGVEVVLERLETKGYRIAIATNNNTLCTDDFMAVNCKGVHYSAIGREAIHPEHMKPDPYMLLTLCKKLQVSNKDIIFIGDNPRDLECARNAGCSFIGMAPTLSKKERLLKVFPEERIMEDLYELEIFLFKMFDDIE